jgi:hypothetical protein
MPDYTSPTGNHWADAIGRLLDTGHYGPGQISDRNSQLFVQMNSGPQAQALATSVAGSGAIGERCEDSDTFRTFFLALVGAPIVITWQVPLPVLIRGGRDTTTHLRTWKPGREL